MSTRQPARLLLLPSFWEKDKHGRIRRTADAVASATSDEELVSRLRANDSRAMEILFDRYSRLFMKIGLRVLRDRGEAEENVQEVFLYAYEKAALFDPKRGSARRWLIQVAYHRAFDRRDHLGRRGFYGGTNIEFMHDVMLSATDLEREVGARLSRVQLEEAFTDLPERQRRTIEMSFFQGLSLREIGENLAEPLANVRHHYYRGLERLRKNAFIQRMREK